MPEELFNTQQAVIDEVPSESRAAEVGPAVASGRENTSSDLGRLGGLKKAAMFLVSLDDDTANEVLSKLSRDEAELLSKEIVNLGGVNKPDLSRVLREFQMLINLGDFIEESGSDNALPLLKKSFSSDVADPIMGRSTDELAETPFDFMKNLETETLLPFLQNEHPQTVALVLSYLEPAQAADILGRMAEDLRSQVVKRIASLDQTSLEAVKQVESGLRDYLSSLGLQEYQEVGGVRSCAEILNSLDRDSQKGILDSLYQDQSELSDSIKKLMFVFEDVIHVDDLGIQAALEEVDNRQVALALKSASDALKDKILGSMSPGVAESIREEISCLGPVKRADVEASQQVIVDIVRRLEEEGEVSISGRGGEGEMID